MDFLRGHGITYVTADEPQFGNPATVPFYPAATNATVYFRFHGRNRRTGSEKGLIHRFVTMTFIKKRRSGNLFLTYLKQIKMERSSLSCSTIAAELRP